MNPFQFIAFHRPYTIQGTVPCTVYYLLQWSYGLVCEEQYAVCILFLTFCFQAADHYEHSIRTQSFEAMGMLGNLITFRVHFIKGCQITFFQ